MNSTNNNQYPSFFVHSCSEMATDWCVVMTKILYLIKLILCKNTFQEFILKKVLSICHLQVIPSRYVTPLQLQESCECSTKP